MTSEPPADLTASPTSSHNIALALDLALRLGEVRLGAGSGAADVGKFMAEVAAAAGLKHVEVDVTYMSLTLTYVDPVDGQAYPRARRMHQTRLDYHALERTDEILEWLRQGWYETDEAWRDAAAIDRLEPRRHKWMTIAGWGVVAAGAALAFGGNGAAALLAAVGAVLIYYVATWFTNVGLPQFYSQAAAGLIASLLGFAAHVCNWTHPPGQPPGQSTAALMTGCVIAVLAGLSLTGSIGDALNGFHVTASARLMEAMIMTAGLLVGMSGGFAMAYRLGVDFTYRGELNGQVDFAIIAAGFAISACAFAYSANAADRALLPVAGLSAASAGIYFAAKWAEFGSVWATGLASLFIGLAAALLGRWLKLPFLSLGIPASIPLLPGLAILRGMAQSSQDPTVALTSFFLAGGVGVALSAGLLLGEFLGLACLRSGQRGLLPRKKLRLVPGSAGSADAALFTNAAQVLKRLRGRFQATRQK